MRVFTFKKINKDKYETLKTSQKSSCLKRHGTFIFNMIDENGNMERKTEYILYYQIQYNDIHITVKAFNDIKDFEGKRTYRENPNNNNVMQDNKRFNDLLKPILNAEGIRDTKHAHIINEYADLIIAYDITRTNNIEYEPIEDMAEEEINNSYNNNQIMFKYIEYQLNENANGFKDLFHSLDQKQNNEIANSCFLNLIVNTYKDQIHKRRKKEEDIKRCSYKKKDDFELTHENLCEFLGVEFKNQDIGITIMQSRKFFEKYNIGLVVVDLYCKKIPNTEITRTEQRINITPQTLYILLHNNHCYKLNCDQDSFIQILNSNEDNKNKIQKLEMSITNKYQFQDFEKQKNVKVIYIEKLDDVAKHIKENAKQKIKFIIDE